jgi:hypothetical protein
LNSAEGSRGAKEAKSQSCICWWTERAGRGILLAWRKNQLMKRGDRRESDNLSTGGATNPLKQMLKCEDTFVVLAGLRVAWPVIWEKAHERLTIPGHHGPGSGVNGFRMSLSKSGLDGSRSNCGCFAALCLRVFALKLHGYG